MTPAAETPSSRPYSLYLVRIPVIFECVADALLNEFGAISRKRLGQDYHLINATEPRAIRWSEAAKFVRWNLPMDHAWPCHPAKMERFIEKAARTLARKFSERAPQGIFIGQLNPGSPDKYYKSLASNLRGRTLQLFPHLKAAAVEEQDPELETLFCLVGKEGLFCGMQSPRDSNGWYPGGSKFIGVESPETISRAGAKIAEALHCLTLYRPPLPAGAHWLELGASPGGMTSELLRRGQRVTAVDRAPLDRRLDNLPGLTFIQCDVAAFTPEERNAAVFDAILCDLNGPPEESIGHVIRLSELLKKPGLILFTLKLPRVENLKEPCELFRKTAETARAAGLRLFAQTHLTHNRHEFTLFFEG